ncbi:hypothetical protein [Xanthomarina sp. F2636L]|uniref:hypothetical protein n=1 Tax=Xanthomarina sp. F2636L TaxID=2996018 RepID=UPI00225E08EA|nr:hypothetical protein [Xanthomarina sp. F2636L]MCX7549520.1 hypothetical protein [Xanthomarina sp. F2636L]
MSYFTKYVIFIMVVFKTAYGFSDTGPELNNNQDIDAVLQEWVAETKAVCSYYSTQNRILYTKLHQIQEQLKNAKNLEHQVTLLIAKDQITEDLKFNKLSEVSDISKIRYLKGLQIIKILYEKNLSLDHHFASVATFNEINNISNPNHYPEFLQLKENLNSNQDKKTGFDLSSILGSNIYTSVVYSIVSLFSNTNVSKSEKNADMKEVECILDFTLRMHNELNTIYFETAFLQKSNDNIMLELEQLFVDFTKPIKYNMPLKECRNTDDWDSVREYLNQYLLEMDKVIGDSGQRFKAHKMQINLEFPIDRLLQFITQYNAFIDQGSKFYEKFGIMLDSYENEQQCATKIPLEYNKLKENISISIEKFNTAYKPVEINGSKMKEILYGINEYD